MLDFVRFDASNSLWLRLLRKPACTVFSSVLSVDNNTASLATTWYFGPGPKKANEKRFRGFRVDF